MFPLGTKWWMASSFLFLCALASDFYIRPTCHGFLLDGDQHMLEKIQILGDQVVSLITQCLNIFCKRFPSLTGKRKIKSEKIKMCMRYTSWLNQAIPRKWFLLTTGPWTNIWFLISKRSSQQLAKLNVEKLRYLLAEYFFVQPSGKYAFNDRAFITLGRESGVWRSICSDIFLAAYSLVLCDEECQGTFRPTSEPTKQATKKSSLHLKQFSMKNHWTLLPDKRYQTYAKGAGSYPAHQWFQQTIFTHTHDCAPILHTTD